MRRIARTTSHRQSSGRVTRVTRHCDPSQSRSMLKHAGANSNRRRSAPNSNRPPGNLARPSTAPFGSGTNSRFRELSVPMPSKRTSDDRLSVVFVPITSVHPNPANPRKIDRGVPHVAASIRRFGFRVPLICRRDGQIVCGHTRYAAALELGLKEVPVHYFDGSDIEAVALGIADNRTAEYSEWDTSALSALLGQLREEDALDGVGFSTAEIDALLNGIQESSPDIASGGAAIASSGPTDGVSARAGLAGASTAAGGSVAANGAAPAAMSFAGTVDDAGPEPPPILSVSRPGDLWALGEHRLLCGDSTNEAHIARVLAGEKAALFSTDPPYCVNYTGMDRPIHDGRVSGKDWSAVYREVDIEDLGTFLDAVFRACLPHLIDSAPFFVWHAHVQQPTIAGAFERHGILLHQVLVWVKPCATFGHSYFRWKHEPVAFGWKKGFKPTHGMAQHDTVIEADWEGKSRVVGNEHPTQKPLKLFELPMEIFTKEGDVCLEPFSGSGSQILAGEKLRRRVCAIEITPTFVDAAIRRWQKATGGVAILQASGQTYAQVAEERGVVVNAESTPTGG